MLACVIMLKETTTHIGVARILAVGCASVGVVSFSGVWGANKGAGSGLWRAGCLSLENCRVFSLEMAYSSVFFDATCV